MAAAVALLGAGDGGTVTLPTGDVVFATSFHDAVHRIGGGGRARPGSGG